MKVIEANTANEAIVEASARPIDLAAAAGAGDIQREEAFEEYWLQGLNGGTRELPAVAKKLGIPLPKVRRWAEKFDWKGRVEFRLAEVAKRMDARAIEQVADIKLRYYGVVDEVIRRWFAERFGAEAKAGMAELTIATMGTDDVTRLIKLALTLLNQPDAIRRIEGHVEHGLEENIHQLSTDDLRALVESRRSHELPAADLTARVYTIDENPAPSSGETASGDNNERKL